MNSHQRRSRYSPVAVGITLFALLGGTLTIEAAGPRARHASARDVTSSAEPLAASSFRPAERAFLNKAVEKTRQQVRLAQVGIAQARNASVRSHARQLAADYKSLNAALDALIRREGGIAGAPVGETSEDYRNLVESAGANFDWEFLRTVEQKTNDVLTLFEQIVSESKDQDVQELAAAQLPTLRAHRSEVTELMKALY